MKEEDLKKLRQDTDGLLSYEYLANHIDQCEPEDIDAVIENMARVDLSGQFLASAARYLHALDSEGYSVPVKMLVSQAIDKDREHRYLPDLLQGLYGEDYQSRAAELSACDDNFRRIYKRLFPSPSL